MAKLTINTGSLPNDGTGDSLKTGASKINSNFNEIYSTFGNGTSLNPNGIIGTQGIKGNTGSQGTQGTQGRQGSQGVIGSSCIIIGSEVNVNISPPGNPTTYLNNTYPSAIPGNSIIDLVTKNLWVYQGGGIWTNVGQIGGQQGSQGVFGAQGIQGKQGTQGLHGIQGPQGLQGLQGLQGIQGLDGLYAGQGTQGISGEQGVQGVQGLEGFQGLQGVQGIQGEQGVQGIQGLDGIYAGQGTQGTFGIQGSFGVQGMDGASVAVPPFDGELLISISDGIVSQIGSREGVYCDYNNTGNVGIGTTIVPSKLTVVGDAQVGIGTTQGVILTSPNGSLWRIIVDDFGVLSTSLVV